MNFKVLIAVVLSLAIATPLLAADHRDAPAISGSPKRDINDVFAFQSPRNANNVVLAMTVNPLMAPNRRPTSVFAQDVLYLINIDENGDARPDKVIQATFTPGRRGQDVKFVGPVVPNELGTARSPVNGPAIMGRTEKRLRGRARTGAVIERAYAGTKDDPFFLDLGQLSDILAGNSTGFTAPFVDTFAGTNVSVIAVELPKSAFSSQKIGVWASTHLRSDGGRQVDRIGIPALNTVFIPSANKNAFNRSNPVNDVANFGGFVTDFAQNVAGKTPAEATAIRDTILPDLLPYDMTQPTNFAALNGRRLSDDAVDVLLGGILFQGNPDLNSDHVDANDVRFKSSFPYFGNPHRR